MPYRFESAGYRRGGASRGGRGGRAPRGSRNLPEIPERFVCVDALRGFDMFWIVGAAYLVSALERWTGSGILTALKGQLHHVEWEEFAFYDLIFPLFVFITGVSAVFSIRKTIAREGRGVAARRILKRGIILFAIGLFYSGGFHGTPYVPPDGGDATSRELLRHLFDNTRLLGVLNRIALAYLAAGFLFLILPVRLLLVVFVGILFGYWSIMARVPIRDIELSRERIAALGEETGETNAMKLYLATTNRVEGRFGPGYNVANHIDFLYLPGHKLDGFYDPEGLLSTLPAIATCLLGMLAGAMLQRVDFEPTTKSIFFLVSGIFLVAIGFVWGFSFPVVKKLWSSSFVCVAGGYSLILLAVFHQIIDVWNKELWCQPFVWVGSNSLVIYLGAQLLNYRKVAERFVGGPVSSHLGRFGDVVLGIAALFVLLAFARFLHRRQLFLRL